MKKAFEGKIKHSVTCGWPFVRFFEKILVFT